MRRPTVGKDEIERPLTERLIGDMDTVARLGVANLRHPGHLVILPRRSDCCADDRSPPGTLHLSHPAKVRPANRRSAERRLGVRLATWLVAPERRGEDARGDRRSPSAALLMRRLAQQSPVSGDLDLGHVLRSKRQPGGVRSRGRAGRNPTFLGSRRRSGRRFARALTMEVRLVGNPIPARQPWLQRVDAVVLDVILRPAQADAERQSPSLS